MPSKTPSLNDQTRTWNFDIGILLVTGIWKLALSRLSTLPDSMNRRADMTGKINHVSSLTADSADFADLFPDPICVICEIGG
jgi:hypothetical protein